jgi:hypothetical protein
MTQQEFTQRTQVEVSMKEFDYIHEMYMNNDMDKDEFCKMWVKMNKTRVERAKAEKKAAERKQKVREILWTVWNKYAFKDYMWKVMWLNHSILNKKEEKAVEEAGIDLRYYSHDAGGYLYYNMYDTLYGIGEVLGLYK